eukprot:COSAG05_NODE_716_length_7804_cov_2.669825_14_plen_104_part_00
MVESQAKIGPGASPAKTDSNGDPRDETSSAYFWVEAKNNETPAVIAKKTGSKVFDIVFLNRRRWGVVPPARHVYVSLLHCRRATSPCARYMVKHCGEFLRWWV